MTPTEIQNIIKASGLTIGAIERKLDMQQGLISRVVNGKRKFSEVQEEGLQKLAVNSDPPDSGKDKTEFELLGEKFYEVCANHVMTTDEMFKHIRDSLRKLFERDDFSVQNFTDTPKVAEHKTVRPNSDLFKYLPVKTEFAR